MEGALGRKRSSDFKTREFGSRGVSRRRHCTNHSLRDRGWDWRARSHTEIGNTALSTEKTGSDGVKPPRAFLMTWERGQNGTRKIYKPVYKKARNLTF